MEFHGTWSVPISLRRAVPWNSMELCADIVETSSSMELHGIRYNLESSNFDDTCSSVEFHGIPWSLECANFDDTNSSMEFHGTLWNFNVNYEISTLTMWLISANGTPLKHFHAKHWARNSWSNLAGDLGSGYHFNHAQVVGTCCWIDAFHINYLERQQNITIPNTLNGIRGAHIQ